MGSTNDRNWYRNSEWDGKAQKEFEERLSKTKSPYSRAQYLRIKGGYLQESNEPKVREAGRDLYLRVIKEFPENYGEVISSYEELGKSYEREGEIKKAEEYYKECIAHQKDYSRYNIFAPLLLAELFVKTNQTAKYHEALAILKEWGETDKRSLLFNSERYRYWVVLARMMVGMNMKDEAVQFAQQALEVAEAGKNPQMSRHPTVGVVKTNPKELEELKDIANKEIQRNIFSSIRKRIIG